MKWLRREWKHLNICHSKNYHENGYNGIVSALNDLTAYHWLVIYSTIGQSQLTFVHSLLYNDLKIFVPSVFLLGKFCIHYLKKRITYASKIQLFCQVEPTLLTYNIKTINTSPSEAITELVKTNCQMKLRHKETKHLLIGIRKNSKLLLHLTNLTIEKHKRNKTG